MSNPIVFKFPRFKQAQAFADAISEKFGLTCRVQTAVYRFLVTDISIGQDDDGTTWAQIENLASQIAGAKCSELPDGVARNNSDKGERWRICRRLPDTEETLASYL
jgi:hypothetical protein